KEITKAKEKNKPFDFGYYLFICKLHKINANQTKKKKNKRQSSEEILWSNPEEEIIDQVREIVAVRIALILAGVGGESFDDVSIGWTSWSSSSAWQKIQSAALSKLLFVAFNALVAWASVNPMLANIAIDSGSMVNCVVGSLKMVLHIVSAKSEKRIETHVQASVAILQKRLRFKAVVVTFAKNFLQDRGFSGKRRLFGLEAPRRQSQPRGRDASNAFSNRANQETKPTANASNVRCITQQNNAGAQRNSERDGLLCFVDGHLIQSCSPRSGFHNRTEDHTD
ncbi:unnamed protein product, partial [Nesidiocoris tenuis]